MANLVSTTQRQEEMNASSGLSIVMTYYKGAEFVFTCINSLLDSYNISNRRLNYEIIVVIDSPEDAELAENKLNEKYKEANLKIIRNALNLGVSRSRNVGLNEIKYNFYTIIDQDDFVNPNYFSVLESSLDSSYDIHLINGSVLFKEINKHVPIYYFEPAFDFKSVILQVTNIYTPGLVIFNKNFVDPKNLFIETSSKYKGTDDWAAYLGILSSTGRNVKSKFINALIFVYCLHANNYSNNKKDMELAAMSVVDHFVNLGPKINSVDHQSALEAQKRIAFLFAFRIEKKSTIEMLSKYPFQLLDHYIFSFVKKGRLNRLIFRIRESL
jgi:hypothetical protein